MSKHIYYLGAGLTHTEYGTKITSKLQELFSGSVVTVTSTAVTITNFGKTDRNITIYMTSSLVSTAELYMYVDVDNLVISFMGGDPASTFGSRAVLGASSDSKFGSSFPQIIYGTLTLGSKAATPDAADTIVSRMSAGDIPDRKFPTSASGETQGRKLFCPNVINMDEQVTWISATDPKNEYIEVPGLWLLFQQNARYSFINWNDKRFFSSASALCFEVPDDLVIETI